ncbi:dnaJ homolog subfamily C member 9-like [Uloborus diversus]|uniref:dnaJ homolog subfamily C member 9-like n=1 Tax=Uloborus diversus TaxID=327109 RepID=UPI002409CAB0|nr:dnaJ homolog subfamily C member 9-like [Uloborus diversus]
MGLLEDCETYFQTNDLYEVLKVGREASDKELKDAYRKRSLLYHPDRVDSTKKEEATRQFQVLSHVHSILSDKDRRGFYDETGGIDDESGLSEGKDWENYWRLLFPKITKKDIENYLNSYKGSDEEKEDLKNHYIKYEGDFNKISENLIGYEFEEETRYHDILTNMIKSEEIPDFPKFSKETKARKAARERRLKKDAVEAEKIGKELGIDSEESLVNAIAKRAQSRESNFDDMIKNLEAKYAKPKSAGRKKTKKC